MLRQFSEQHSLAGSRSSPDYSGRFSISSFILRSPYFGWFPWDKVKGGWRLRVADFRMFERRAAAWLSVRQDDFDLVQACKLPLFIAEAKNRGVRLPMVIRLTAPNYYDPDGGIGMADAVIASGMTVEQLRATNSFECTDIPNAVDTDRFTPGLSDFRARAGIADNEVVFLYVTGFRISKITGCCSRRLFPFYTPADRHDRLRIGAKVDRQRRRAGGAGGRSRCPSPSHAGLVGK